MSAFIDSRRDDFRVEPICRALGVSASAYYERRAGRRPARAIENERLLELIRTTHAKNYSSATGAPGRRCSGRVSRALAAARCGG